MDRGEEGVKGRGVGAREGEKGERGIDDHCDCCLIKDNNVVSVAHGEKQQAISGRWR